MTKPAPFRSFRFVLAGAIAGGLLLAGGIFAVIALQPEAAPQTASDTGEVTIGGPFTLTNGNGQVVTDRDFHDKYMLVYFGYTYCPDVCPTTLSAVAGALEKLGPTAARVVPIFITVDPQRDTPSVMKQYTAAFGPNFVGLSGTPLQIAEVTKEYRVYYAIHRTGDGANDYTVDHSSILYLMGPDGRFIAPVRADQTADSMAAEIAREVS